MKKKVRSKKMMWTVLGILLLVIIGILIFFKIPYSKIKADFNTASTMLMEEAVATNEVFTEEDIKDLPAPVKKYFSYCGFIGTKKMS